MPTREERERAKLKATSADPLVWAMKSVDDRFPDEREKSIETVKAEAEVERKLGPVDAADEMVEDESAVSGAEIGHEDVDFAEEFGDDFDEDYDDDDEELLNESDILDEPDAENSIKMINALSLKKQKEVSEKTATKATRTEKPVTVAKPVETAKPTEIVAEGKLAMPTEDGVVTMEVTPMRQNVSNLSPAEVKKAPKEENTEPEPKSKFKFMSKNKSNAKDGEKAGDAKTQVKLMNLEFKQKKMMIGFAVLVILAVTGVCFGVIATMKQGQAVDEMVAQIASVSNNDDEMVDGEYINLKDWGIKIKIIAGLDNVSFNTITNDYAEIQIWGSKRDAGANYVPSFAKQIKNTTPLGTMVRVPRYERAAAGRLIWYDDYYNYYYQGPSGVPNVSEDEMSWWVESYLLVKEMLTNADNYASL